MSRSNTLQSVWLMLGVSVVVTLSLYARSLSLPFYSDDLVQLAWLRGLTLGELWGQVSPYGYYRPLAFSLWLIWRDAGLPVTPAALRIFNLILHALAATLVGMLAVELDREGRLLAGVYAAAIFAAFPFSYQAVPWVSAIFYPLVVVMILGSVLTYLAARRKTGGARYTAPSHILSLVLVGLAPFAHENGMLTGATVALVEVADWMQRRAETGEQYPSRFPLLHIGLNAAFLIVWFAIRPGGVTTLDLTPPGLWRNLTILIMGLSFPLMPVVTWLRLPQAAGVWIFSLMALALLVGLTWKQWPVMLVGAGWFVLSIGPVLATMRPEWLLDAPRFLYPAAVGAAVWWGSLTPLPTGEVGKKKQRFLSSALVAGILIPAGYFVYEGVGWHLRGGQVIRELAEAARDHPDEALLAINLPNELVPTYSLYPLFDGGAILLPLQVPETELTASHRPDDRARTVGAILTPVEYGRTTYGPQVEGEAAARLIEAGTVAVVADYMADPIRLRYAGRRLADYRLPDRPLAYFGDFITLWEAESEDQDGILRLLLRWEMIQPGAGTLTVFVHVADEGGAMVAQGDGDPIMGLYPFGQFTEWIILEDVRYIRLPGGGPYAIYVGVWDPVSGERLPARGGNYPDGRVRVGTVTP